MTCKGALAIAAPQWAATADVWMGSRAVLLIQLLPPQIGVRSTPDSRHDGDRPEHLRARSGRRQAKSSVATVHFLQPNRALCDHYMHAANSISGSANTSYGNAHASGAFVWGVPSPNCANVTAQALPAYSQQSAIDVEKCIFSVSAPRARALQAGTSEGMPMPWQRSVAATACAPGYCTAAAMASVPEWKILNRSRHKTAELIACYVRAREV